MKMADIGYEMLSTFMEEHSIFMEEDSIFMEEPPYLIFTEDPLIKTLPEAQRTQDIESKT